jgi:hypothetical protein
MSDITLISRKIGDSSVIWYLVFSRYQCSYVSAENPLMSSLDAAAYGTNSDDDSD